VSESSAEWKCRAFASRGMGRFDVPRFQLPSHGVRSGSRDLDATGPHTRPSHRLSGPPAGTIDENEAIVGPQGDRNATLTWLPDVDILSRSFVRAESENFGISGEAERSTSGDRIARPPVDDVEPVIQ
jgi:hypothetical protein